MNQAKLGGGKTLVSISRPDQRRLLENLGYHNNHSASVSRSRRGDRLFIQFDDHTSSYGPAVKHKLAIISADGIALRDLPGRSVLDDEGEPVCWITWEGKESRIQFVSGPLLATNEHWYGASDGKFIPMFRAHGDHWWVARVESPMNEIVAFDWGKEFQLLISKDEKLHVFVRGQPEGKPRPDRWFVLKHYEYRVVENRSELLRVQDFYFTWCVLDFDPDTGLMLARSWDTMFPHGLLVNTVTGSRQRTHAGGYFLEENVGTRFKELLHR